MSTVFGAFWGIAVVLELLLINRLSQGPYRRHPVLFVTCLVLLLTNVVDATAYFDLGAWTRHSRNYFWFNEVLRQGFVYLLMISLIFQSMKHSRERDAIRRWLVLGTVFVLGVSTWWYRNPNLISQWMTNVIRTLSFCAMLMNAVLWSILVRGRTVDRELLLISGGLGLQMAGGVIGHSLRLWSTSAGLLLAGNLIVITTHLLCLFVWWQAFRDGTPATAVAEGGR